MRGSMTIAALAAVLAVTPVVGSAGRGADAPGRLERTFAPGGQITMDLSAGEYVIEGKPDPAIRLRWTTPDQADRTDAVVRVETAGNAASVYTDGPRNNFHVEIEVPARSNLSIDLTAGDFTLHGVEGHADISAWAGELKIGVGKAADYRHVHASVTAGEIQADPFEASKGGLFRSFTWEGKGSYDLRVRLTAGKIVLRSDR